MKDSKIGEHRMRYQLALEIHERIEEVLRLIKTGEYSTPALAETIGVSIPTISRIVAALREQGHDIQAKRTSHGWRYVIDDRRPIKKHRLHARLPNPLTDCHEN